MKLERGLGWLALASCALACNGLSGLGFGTETPHPLPTIAPITATPPATSTTVTLSRLAWVSGSSLNLTNFSADGLGTTNHLGFAEKGLPSASELAWSPSGQSLAVSTGSDAPQIYEVDEGAGLTTLNLLGPGARPAWSADGQTLMVEREGNLWLIDLAAHTSHQITHQSDWQWGNAVFAPDGKAILVAGAPTDSLGSQGSQGNTEFYLYSIPLDGSGTLSALPALSNGSPFFGRLPYDLQLSPDKHALAFSTSAHENACASPTAFYVGGADGSHWHEVDSPTINAALDSDKEIYQEGQGLAWMPDSTALVLDSFALDCSGPQPAPIVGPLLSIVGLDGVERASLPLGLANLSVDASGRLLAGLVYPADGSPALVTVYSLVNGKPVAELGEGTAVEFGP